MGSARTISRWELVLWGYLLWLAFFVVVKVDGDPAYLAARMGRCLAIRGAEPGYQLNFVPLASIRMQLRHWPAPWAVKNLLGNVAAFVPFGLLLPLACERFRRFLRLLPLCLAVICAIEVFQYGTLLGSCDIDDLILNLLGCLGGYLIFRCAVGEERI